MPSYRNLDFAYENGEDLTGDYQLDRSKKDYSSRGRSLKALRKRSRGRSSYSASSIGHRRNKRMTW